MGALEVTLDTNLLLEFWQQGNRQSTVERLLALSRSGVVDLAVSARIRSDVPRPPLCDEIDRLPELNVNEGYAVTSLGGWSLGRDVLGSEEFSPVSQELEAELRRRGRKPLGWRDWDHLHAHFLSGRSAFLTWDKGILEVATELKASLGITVSTPENWLTEHGL